jgi:predicted RNase H-like nuclease (RuvC/YqgF family)
VARPIEADLVELKERYGLLAEAHDARGRLLARQRWEFADRLRDELEERDREIEQLQAEVERLERSLEGRQRELDDLRNTKTFRYSAALRRGWGRLRRR